MNSRSNEIETQRQYYTDTAPRYDDMHVQSKDEHFLALAFLVAMLDFLEIRSVLDVGSGTGRVLHFVKSKRADLRLIGIEPVPALREAGYSSGLSPNELIAGDATNLSFLDGEFDLVCAFGVLHHIRNPSVAVSEMLRVAKRGIFISDSNNFGQGPRYTRAFKQMLDACGVWRLADFIKTRGKGYTISEGDGLAYSYSIFNNYGQIAKQCPRVHWLNTQTSAPNLYRTAGHVALLGVKE